VGIVVSNSLELIEKTTCLYLHYTTMVKANTEKHEDRCCGKFCTSSETRLELLFYLYAVQAGRFLEKAF